MKLYLISKEYGGYDIFDSAVVAAENESDARNIHPDGESVLKDGGWATKRNGHMVAGYYAKTWAEPSEIDSITVEYLGETNKDRGVILASFNAG